MKDAEKATRPHVFHGITRSMCPECRKIVDAQVLIRNGAVYLRKYCLEHGWHEALISSDADWHVRSVAYNKPGALPLTTATPVKQGCPDDCGLCPEHQQHTCLGLIEITTRCNLTCPTCFADSGEGYDLRLEQVEAMLDRFVAAEGNPEVVQLSGGEPTIHPQIMQIVAAARSRGIPHVMVNTNGVRLAQEPDFVRRLAEHGPTIYLQFDNLHDSTYRTLRGSNLIDIKRRALDNLAEAGLYANLVTTVARDVNDGELGDILRFGLEHPAVLGLCYQPLSYAGRHAGEVDPLRRTTVTDVLHRLEEQSGGLFKVSDFRPVPCPHPDCSACAYAYVHEGEVTPISRVVDVDEYLDLAVNRTVVDISNELRPVLEALSGMAAVMGVEKAASALSCAACGIDLSALDIRNLHERFFMIQVHGFMDEYNFDLERLMKCCIHQLLPDGRAVPFCAYNILGYREEVRREQEALRDR